MTEKKSENQFICSVCNFDTAYNYFGKKPPFAKSLVLLEDAYVMKDPFSTEGGIITLGSHCSLCQKPVCLSNECSLFFTKRFCIDCAKLHMSEFPIEIKQELLRKHKKDPS
ncbi:cysteine-rich DPF motif domain-containing protein 1-like [Gigantopelta aegis]|uniref:cysteine-rich DPF motif domain-containing protein 1-like n=1 Tax=Gigantopelta aegis TaxID=1735272 RepID=UPI001B887A5F|nr:cysteine-rich DPF motif domain-containing protein 1-like [Gigantopelta aegis]